MKNMRLVLEYDGSRYDGWQLGVKTDSNQTIQGKLESVLSVMEGKETSVMGAVRTEPGVHAYGQIANFMTSTNMKPFEIKHYLNRYLPRDIAVLRVDEVPERFHSSFNVKSVLYEYKISIADVPSVFERKYQYHCFDCPDLQIMKEWAEALVGEHDLKAFSDNKRQKKSTIRKIHKIVIYGDDKEISISIHADDFWPNMARIIVGTLLDAGLKKISAKSMKEIIDGKDREKAGHTADPKGLFLTEVFYHEA